MILPVEEYVIRFIKIVCHVIFQEGFFSFFSAHILMIHALKSRCQSQELH